MKREVFSYVAVACFVGLIAYFLLFNLGAKKASKKGEQEEEKDLKREIEEEIEQAANDCNIKPKWGEESPDITEVSEGLDISEIVELGDYSEFVLEIQRRMNKNYKSSLPLTGKFCCETHREVLKKTGLNSVIGVQVSDFKE